MTYSILICDDVHPACRNTFLKESDFHVDSRPGLSQEELLAIIGNYDGLVARSSTRVTASVMTAAERLRVIGRTGVGVDNVDVEAATHRGILVMNTPGVNTVATAEHTMALLLALARKIPQADVALKRGEWRRADFKGVELSGKTLGIIGLGRVGQAVALRARAFGMTVVACDPFVDREQIAPLQVELMALNDLLGRADFISVHVPLIQETRNMISGSELDMCKDGVSFLNCARGGIVHENALFDGLRSGKIAGAALDVFEQEPPGDSDLLKLPNVIVTPHVAGQTHETAEKSAHAIAAQMIDYLKRGEIKNGVNAP